MYIKVSFFIKKNIYMYLLKCFPFNFKYSEIILHCLPLPLLRLEVTIPCSTFLQLSFFFFFLRNIYIYLFIYFFTNKSFFFICSGFVIH